MNELAVSHSAQFALLRLLVKGGFLDQGTADTYVERDCCPIAFFARQGKFEEAPVLEHLANSLHLPLLPEDKAVAAQVVHLLEHPIFEKLTLSRWRELRSIPVELNDKSVTVAMANPLDHEAKGALEFDFGRQVKIWIGSEHYILGLLTNKLNDSALFDLDSIATTKSESSGSALELSSQESNIFQGDASSAPIIRLVNKIFGDAVSLGASDVHLTPDKDKVSVKLRIDGIMQPLLEYPAAARASVSARIKLLCGMDITEHRKPQDGRLRIKTPLGARDLRLSVVPTVHGENIVARILSSELTHVGFESLGVDEELDKRLKAAISGSSRVVLVTGPTGSGKSSTLYAGLLHLHDGKTNIITIEDPIEYRVAGLNQIQVNAKTSMTFADTLRAVLRQDPDVIMVGEIRDAETASIAMQVAQTGHLVLSTLHTNTAVGAITRLKDLGIPSYLIASSLGSVVAQRLVRRLCGDCAKPCDEPTKARLEELGVEASSARLAIGCPECGGSGYRGRCGVFSLLDIDDSVREAIRSENSEQEIERLAVASGFESLEKSGLDMVARGVTTLDELERGLGPISKGKIGTASLDVSSSFNRDSNNRVEQSGAPLQKRKILLVEDEENTRTVLTMLLQRERFEVFAAEDGIQGLDQVYQHIPELIITDLMMPKMGGIEMVQKIKNDPRTKDIPILVLTAADGSENELSLINGGVDDFISKTTDSKIIIARVNRLLSRI